MLIARTKCRSKQAGVADIPILYSRNFQQKMCLLATWKFPTKHTPTKLTHWVDLFDAFAISTV